MPLYNPSSSYFVTLYTMGRKAIFKSATETEVLQQAVRKIRRDWPVRVDAAVVLPNHLHAIITLTNANADINQTLKAFKEQVASMINLGAVEFEWEQQVSILPIPDDDILMDMVDFVHYDPVRHELCCSPVEWPYSSIHPYIAKGIVPRNWASVAKPRPKKNYAESAERHL